MIGAETHPFFDDWLTRIDDPVREWARVSKVSGARAASLVDDFPIAAALVRTKTELTLGPIGLRFNSQFIKDPDAPPTPADTKVRRRINRVIKTVGEKIDAGAILTRTEFDEQLDWSATVWGDGFAIRVWQADRVPSTRWRVIHPLRVRNPRNQANSERFHDGIEFDSEGRRVAIWVDKSRYSPGGLQWVDTEPIRIKWNEDDGTPNVVHHVFYRRPGSARGLTGFAPLILPARLLQMVDVTYVAGKRAQMSAPMLLEVPDLDKAREQYRGTRFEHMLLGPGTKATLNTAKFEGDDHAAFEDTQVRGLSAAWGQPWELVLGDHSSKSGAAARSLWQQAAVKSEGFQRAFADNAKRPMDESVVRESNARDPIPELSDNWADNMAGAYQGPPPINPDPKKEAESVELWIKNGMSKTTAFAMAGFNYDDEREQRKQDDDLDAAAGIEDEPEVPPTEPTPPPKTDAPADADPTQEDDAPPSSVVLVTRTHKAASAAAHESLRDDFLAGARLIVDGMPKTQSPHITVNNHIPAASSTINVAAADPTPIQVNVAAPNPTPVDVHVAAPTVNVAAADPAPPTPIQINVAAPAVTVENTVEVPSRTIIAKPNGDGSVTMTPQG